MIRIVNTRNLRPDQVVDFGIEDMEKQGQEELCQSNQLPMNGLGSLAAVEKYRGLVVQPSPGDPLFVDVKEWPEGWVIKPTEHTMWSELYDGEDLIAQIFYKAAYYDRRAELHVRPSLTE